MFFFIHYFLGKIQFDSQNLFSLVKLKHDNFHFSLVIFSVETTRTSGWLCQHSIKYYFFANQFFSKSRRVVSLNLFHFQQSTQHLYTKNDFITKRICDICHEFRCEKTYGISTVCERQWCDVGVWFGRCDSRRSRRCECGERSTALSRTNQGCDDSEAAYGIRDSKHRQRRSGVGSFRCNVRWR